MSVARAAAGQSRKMRLLGIMLKIAEIVELRKFFGFLQ